MGKVIARLGATRLPRQTIFGDRFVVECCETFHMHFRNMRLELEPEDFRRVMTALDETANSWRENGQPSSHAHLELGRALVSGSDEPVFSIELCENLYKKWPTGWDARFHREDSFVHVHWRDLRLETSNAEFLELAETTRSAYEKLRAWKLKTLSEIFDLLDREGIVYAVIRNWEKLPDEADVGPHSDLDLLVHPDHEDRFDALLDARPTTDDPDRVQRRIDVITEDGPSFVLTDVRVPGDGYFPLELAHGMLARRVRHKNFWVLSAEDHHIGLAYHIIHHKGFATGDYWVKLTWLSEYSGLPAPDDADCTRYAAALLDEAGLPAIDADDRTVRPVLPLLHPRSTLVTSRFLAVHAGRAIFSRVYVVDDSEEKRVVKQTTDIFAQHEHRMLSMLDDPRIPRVGEFRDLGGHSVFDEEYVEGISLADAETLMRGWRFEDARRFTASLIDIGRLLAEHGMRHRDIRADNILVRDGLPVLLDFGWAETTELLLAEPEGGWLGGDARAPDEGPCDAYSIGFVLREHVVDLFPDLASIAQELVECRAGDEPDWSAILGRVEALEEKRPDDPTSRFLQLVEAGRYDEARGAAVHLDDTGEEVGFWLHHLNAVEVPEAAESPLGEAPATPPSAARRSGAIASRILREHLSLCGGAQVGSWAFTLVTSHLESAAPPRSVVEVLSRHLDAFMDAVPVDVVARAFELAERGDEWLVLRAKQIAESDDVASRDAFLARVEEGHYQPLVSAAAALARLYERAGRLERAAALATFVLDNDPYVAECARILADSEERRGENAVEAWRRVVRLRPDDAHARARIRRWRRSTTARETVDSLPTAPHDLLAFLRNALAEKRLGDALAAANKLATISPDDPTGLALVAKLTDLANKKQRGGEIRVVVDPLRDGSYEPDPNVVRAELEAIVKTPFGRHPIVREAHRVVLGDEDPTIARP